MFCPKCGKENPEGSRICMFCGTPIEAQVPMQQMPQTPVPQASQPPQAPQGYGVGVNNSYGVGTGYGTGNGYNQAQPGNGQSVSDAMNGLGQAVGGLAKSVSSNMSKMGVIKMGPFTLDFSNIAVLMGLAGSLLYFLGAFLPYFTLRFLGERESLFLIKDSTALAVVIILLGLGSAAMVLLDNKILHAAAGGVCLLLFLIVFFANASDIRDAKDWGIRCNYSIGFFFLLLGALALVGGAVLRFMKEGFPKVTVSRPGMPQQTYGGAQQQPYGNAGMQQPMQQPVQQPIQQPMQQAMQQPMQQPYGNPGMPPVNNGGNFNNGQGNA